ncbi:MAG: YceD family protein [Streptococcaceae bacterium]|jgi:uncharacterized protein|nr:YceD family protein [Streptococcaceae bacterium]
MEIKWSLQELLKKVNEVLEFSHILQVEDELKTREKEILAVSDVTVNGTISVLKEEFILSYNMEYFLTLPSSRSLIPVKKLFSIQVTEVFMTKESFEQKKLEDLEEEVLIIEANTLSLSESVKDNILLEIPLKVLTEEEEHTTHLPKGQDWEVISEEGFKSRSKQSEEEATSPFSGLEDLFKEDE